MARNNKPLTFSFHLIDREAGTVTDIDKVPEEALEKMSERLGKTMSEYYTQHMDEYVQLPKEWDVPAAAR